MKKQNVLCEKIFSIICINLRKRLEICLTILYNKTKICIVSDGEVIIVNYDRSFTKSLRSVSSGKDRHYRFRL